MKITHISVLAALVVASQVAMAQPRPGATGPTGGTTGATGGASDASTVTNIGSTTSTVSSSPNGALPSDSGITDPSMSDPSMSSGKGEMVNTGGEPELMLMGGLVLAACGLLLRRKMVNQGI